MRLPDVCVVPIDLALKEDVRVTPPLLAIEIVSPDDAKDRVLVRLEDFLNMVIEHIWLLDPLERVAFTYTAQGLRLVDTPRLALPNSPIYLDLPELFAALD